MKTIKTAFLAIVLPLLFWLCNSEPLLAQKSDRLLTETEKKEIIDTAFSLLRNNYIFPEKIAVMEKTIKQNLVTGQYSPFANAADFLTNLNKDLETLSNDRHVDIFFDPVRVKQIEAESENKDDQLNFDSAFLKRAKFENYMVRKAERLEGNVGYLKLDLFVDLHISKPTLVSAMKFLSNSSALIIDLRRNGGGHASTVNFLLTYFLPDSTLVSQFTSRLTKTTTNLYTEHDETVQKFSKDIPLYLLVSKRTSSAAEAFAYTLQAFNRAIVVGDTTNGEANPGYLFAINKDMFIMIPTSVNTNPITKTNWQGIGVVPNMQISSEKALAVAQGSIYKEFTKTAGDSELKSMYEWMATGSLAEAYPVKLSEKEQQPFVGDYSDNRVITFENGLLYYQRKGISNKVKLIPLTQELFQLEGIPYFRIRFIKDQNGKTIALEGMYDDGKRETSKKLG